MQERWGGCPPEMLAAVWAEIIRDTAWLELSGAEAKALLWALAMCDDSLQVAVSSPLLSPSRRRTLHALARRGLLRVRDNGKGGLEIQLVRKLGGSA